MGEPTWNGKVVEGIDLTTMVLPFVNGAPFCLLLEGCEDQFLPVFKDVIELRKVMDHLNGMGLLPMLYRVKQIDDATEFFDSVREVGVRIMLNPQVIDAHHTKWLEVIREGDEWRFVRKEN